MKSARSLVLVPAGACLLIGLDAALILAGIPAGTWERAPDAHGPIMVLGFLGCVISLERAVALRAAWGYAAPLLLGIGGLALVTPAPPTLAWGALVTGTLAFVLLYAALWRRNADAVVLAEGVGALAAVCSAVLWPRAGAGAVLPWLIIFVVLTIAAERVELAAIAMPRTARRDLLLMTAAMVACGTLAMLAPTAGAVSLGVVLLGSVAWLSAHDIARRTIRARGLPRFSAAGILAGYAWLVVAALLLVRYGAVGTTAVNEPAAYDAVIHAVFLGFAMSMVFAHAPIIVPAVIGRPLPYHPALWLPPAVLHLGLLLRLGVGDGLGVRLPWQVGATLNVTAILLFLGLTVWRVAGTGSRADRASRQGPLAERQVTP